MAEPRNRPRRARKVADLALGTQIAGGATTDGTGRLDESWDLYKKTGDLRARNHIVEQYQPLARSLALRARAYALSVASQTREVEDLFGIAQEGLIRAVESFDPAKGVPFSSYARFRVMGHIKDTLRGDDFLSRRQREKVKAWLRGEGLTGAGARQVARLAAGPPVVGSQQVLERVPDDSTVEELGIAHLFVAELLQQLGPVQRAVVTYRYLHGMSFSAIGTLLYVTESRACQLNRLALEKLRRSASLKAS